MAAPAGQNQLPKQTPNNNGPICSVDVDVSTMLRDSQGKPVTGQLSAFGYVTPGWRYLFGKFLTALSTFSATVAGVVPASGGGTTNFLRADGTWAAPPSSGVTLFTARQTSDQSVTNSTTLVNSTGLTISGLLAGATYEITGGLFFTDASAGGIKYDLGGGSATATTYWAGSVVTTTQVGAVATSLITVITAASSTNANQGDYFYGVITVNAGGTLTLRFAQNATNATPTILKTGSWLNLQKIN